jgi:hypothetical protein
MRLQVSAHDGRVRIVLPIERRDPSDGERYLEPVQWDFEGEHAVSVAHLIILADWATRHPGDAPTEEMVRTVARWRL